MQVNGTQSAGGAPFRGWSTVINLTFTGGFNGPRGLFLALIPPPTLAPGCLLIRISKANPEVLLLAGPD